MTEDPFRESVKKLTTPNELRPAEPERRWASTFSQLKPTKQLGRSEEQQAALTKATADALEGLPMSGTAIEDGILTAASEQLKPLRIRQRHEAIRRERQVPEASTETDGTAQVDEDFDPEAASAEQEQEDAETDAWLAQFEADDDEFADAVDASEDTAAVDQFEQMSDAQYAAWLEAQRYAATHQEDNE